MYWIGGRVSRHGRQACGSKLSLARRTSLYGYAPVLPAASARKTRNGTYAKSGCVQPRSPPCHVGVRGSARAKRRPAAVCAHTDAANGPSKSKHAVRAPTARSARGATGAPACTGCSIAAPIAAPVAAPIAFAFSRPITKATTTTTTAWHRRHGRRRRYDSSVCQHRWGYGSRGR